MKMKEFGQNLRKRTFFSCDKQLYNWVRDFQPACLPAFVTTKMSNNTRWTLLFFMNYMKPLIFLFKFFHPHKGGGRGVSIHGFVAEYPPPAPHREIGILMTSTFENINELYLQFPQPPMPSELLKFSIENAFLGEHDQRLFFKNIIFKNWIFGMLEKVTIPNIRLRKISAKILAEIYSAEIFHRRNFSTEIFRL